MTTAASGPAVSRGMNTVIVGTSSSALPCAPGAGPFQSGNVAGSGNNGTGRGVCAAADNPDASTARPNTPRVMRFIVA
jgi:hypothetical protein